MEEEVEVVVEVEVEGRVVVDGCVTMDDGRVEPGDEGPEDRDGSPRLRVRGVEEFALSPRLELGAERGAAEGDLVVRGEEHEPRAVRGRDALGERVPGGGGGGERGGDAARRRGGVAPQDDVARAPARAGGDRAAVQAPRGAERRGLRGEAEGEPGARARREAGGGEREAPRGRRVEERAERRMAPRDREE